MARIKYTYDTRTCRYERVRRTWTDIILNLGGYLSAALLVAVVVVLIRNAYYETPFTRKISRENATLKEHHQKLKAELIDLSSVIEALNERNNNIYRKIYEAEPITALPDGNRLNFSKQYKSLLERGWKNKDHVDSLAAQIDMILAGTSNRTMADILSLLRKKNITLTSIPSIQPVENKDLKKLSSGFGMRINPFHKGRVMHFGIDFATHRGEEVYATAAGKIKTVKSGSRLETGYGNYVDIDHGNGYVTRYAHLGDIKVKRGARVKRGEVIALAGNSGGSIAPHVHYEVIKDGNQINPLIFMVQGLDDHMYRSMKQIAARENQSLD